MAANTWQEIRGAYKPSGDKALECNVKKNIGADILIYIYYITNIGADILLQGPISQ